MTPSRAPGLLAELELAGQRYQVDLAGGISIGIPIGPDRPHPRFFIDHPARFRPLSAGQFNGRVSEGCSCNADEVSLVPHCHGTHTEGRGHIEADRRPVNSRALNAMLPACLVSMTPDPDAGSASPRIAADQLAWFPGCRALIIRTLPNSQEKCGRDYSHTPPYPLLSTAAMRRLVAGGIDHLLIDTPSVDAADDEALPLHRIFWALENAMSEPADLAEKRREATITEMIFVPDSLPDGPYLLQLAPGTLIGDATPSNPILFALT